MKLLKKVILLNCILSSFSSAYAADININSEVTSSQTLTENNQKITVGSGGNINYSGSSGAIISSNGSTGLQIEIDAGEGKGVYNDNGPAISVYGGGGLASLNLISGVISSASTNSYSASVYVEAYFGNTDISISEGAKIENAGSGYGLYLFNENSPTFIVNNRGSILNDSYSAASIYNEDYSSNNLTINNYGLIQNSNSAGDAIVSGNAGSYVVNNFSSGIINGDITGIFNINNEGNINGNIMATKGGSEVVNNGVIIGNINFSSISSSFTLGSRGSVDGELTTSDKGDIINFNGGTFDGYVNLSENSILNINESYTSSDFRIKGKSANQGTLVISSGASFTNTMAIGDPNAISNLDIRGRLNVASAIYANNISIASAGILNISGSAIVAGEINGSSANSGTINIGSGLTFSNSLNIGATNAISNLNIDGTLTTAANIYANNISLSNTGILNLSESKEVVGKINGVSANEGTINVISGSSFTNSSTIGATNAISSLNIDGTLTAASDIYARNISLSDSGILNLSESKIFSGIIDGSSANQGTINVASGSSFTSSATIGATNAISNLNIAGTLNAGGNISANDIALSGSLNLGNTSKIITGNIAGSGVSSLNFSGASHVINGNLSLVAGDTIAVSANSGSNVGKATANGVTTIDSGVKLAVNLNNSSNYKYFANGSKYTIIDASPGSTINKVNDSDINLNGSGSNKSKILTLTTSTVGDDLFLEFERKPIVEITSSKKAQNVYSAINMVGESATGELRLLQQYIDNSTNISEVESALKSVTPQADNGVTLASVTVVNNSIKTVENRLNAVRNASFDDQNFNATQTSVEKSNVDVIESKSSTDSAKSTPYKLITGISINKVPEASSAKSVTPVYKLKSGLAFGDKIQNSSIWAQTFGTSAKQGEVGNNDGYKSKALGFAFGYDKEVAKDTRLGISFSYANSIVTSKDSLKKTDIDTYQINAYGGKDFGKYFLDSIIGFSWNEYSSSRIISSVNSAAKSNYSGQSYVAKVRTGLNQYLGNGFNLSPEASLNYVRNNNSDYAENGAGTLNLEVKGSSTNFLEARFGTTLSHKTITKKGTEITPKISASYGYNFLSSDQTTTSNFVGHSVTFNTVSSKLDPKSLKLGAGIDIYDADSITLSADYVLEKKQKYQSHSGVLKAKYDF